MKTWEVEVHLGSGGDTDSIATYLVYAPDEGAAEDLALGQSRHLINATANLVRNPGAVDEMDYDGVLGQGAAIRFSKDRDADESGYELSDPKHPRHHDVYSDAADL